MAAAQSLHRGDQGRSAASPSDMPAGGWWSVIKRVYAEVIDDRVMLTAAGVTYYLLLALFPALAAFVSLYGFVADPTTIADHISFLGGLLPSGGVEIIESQLDALSRQDTDALSFGFALGLLIAIWSANSGVKAIFDAMNVVYEEAEKRSFLKYNLMALAFTMGGLVVGILFLITVGIVPVLLAALRLEDWAEILVRWLRWPVLLSAVALAISAIYRWAPAALEPNGAGLPGVQLLPQSCGSQPPSYSLGILRILRTITPHTAR